MDRNKEIEVWRETEAAERDDDSNIIASLFNSCIQVMQALITRYRKTPFTKFDCQGLEDAAATLYFWGDEFGVSSGGLDEALQRSEETRDLTLSVLISLGEFLSDGEILTAIYKRMADRTCRFTRRNHSKPV